MPFARWAHKIYQARPIELKMNQFAHSLLNVFNQVFNDRLCLAFTLAAGNYWATALESQATLRRSFFVDDDLINVLKMYLRRTDKQVHIRLHTANTV